MLWSNKVIDKFPDKVLKKWLILAALECPVFTDIEFVDLNLP
jgi:CMP-N-acetylneuraminic acid synthetase